jgi:hypothetical protein
MLIGVSNNEVCLCLSFHRIVDLHIDVVLMQVVWNIFSVAETIKYFISVDGK